MRFKIICEGKLTEYVYFSALSKEYNANIEILKQTGTPAKIASSILDEKLSDTKLNRRRGDSWASKISYWAVFDRDEHPYVLETIQKLRDASVGYGYSNPCFEIWLILHYQDFDRSEHRHDMQRQLEALDETYSRSGGKEANMAALIRCVEKAEERARQLEARRDAERNVEGNPSTTVWRLTKALREA